MARAMVSDQIRALRDFADKNQAVDAEAKADWLVFLRPAKRESCLPSHSALGRV